MRRLATLVLLALIASCHSRKEEPAAAKSEAAAAASDPATAVQIANSNCSAATDGTHNWEYRPIAFLDVRL